MAVRAWQGLAERLAPIIGERGFRVLYARSVHLTQPDFPWLLDRSPQSDAPEPLFAGLRESLELQRAALAADAHRSLLRTFTGLLGSLIGELLTARLVREALPDGSTAGLAEVVLELTRISVQEAPPGVSTDGRSQESSNDR